MQTFFFPSKPFWQRKILAAMKRSTSEQLIQQHTFKWEHFQTQTTVEQRFTSFKWEWLRGKSVYQAAIFQHKGPLDRLPHSAQSSPATRSYAKYKRGDNRTMRWEKRGRLWTCSTGLTSAQTFSPSVATQPLSSENDILCMRMRT